MAATVFADITLTGGGSVDPFDGEREWQHNTWTVEFRYRGRKMEVEFHTGDAIGEPEPSDVLECLLSDATSAGQPFEDWAADYGYDVDSRKAERTWRAVEDQTEKLRKLLGEDFERATTGDVERNARRLASGEDL